MERSWNTPNIPLTSRNVWNMFQRENFSTGKPKGSSVTFREWPRPPPVAAPTWHIHTPTERSKPITDIHTTTDSEDQDTMTDTENTVTDTDHIEAENQQVDEAGAGQLPPDDTEDTATTGSEDQQDAPAPASTSSP